MLTLIFKIVKMFSIATFSSRDMLNAWRDNSSYPVERRWYPVKHTIFKHYRVNAMYKNDTFTVKNINTKITELLVEFGFNFNKQGKYIFRDIIALLM